MSEFDVFLIEKSVLREYHGTGGEVSVPAGVTSIGERAFAGCLGLTGITIPEGVTSIGYEAFRGCKSLSGANLPEGLT